jgi:bifunctional UDP-N-acetylglucosamine pyrophosphorylase / glucosamine-1-phosphate N-acetyltransferase
VAARSPARSLAVVVLAAGQGKRMKSDLPKVLHPVCGRPSLWHVLQAARAARPQTITVIVHAGADEVEAVVRSWGIRPAPVLVEQAKPLGTGHAVLVAEEAVHGASDVLVLAGDDPLVTGEHVREVLKVHRRTRAAATLLTTTLDDPTGYARVVRDGNLLVDLVGEDEAERDGASRSNREVAALVYAFRREDLFGGLPLVPKEPRSGEFYLFRVLDILRDKGERLSAVPADLGGAMGLNTRAGLASVTRIIRERIVRGHMANGVTFLDPTTCYVDVDVRIGRDSTILPMTVLEGATRIGEGCVVGPATRIVDSRIEAGAEVTFSVVRQSRIGREAAVGPYASLRPGTVILDGGKAGTFVEIKASRVGKRSKVPHLAYVGDATIGDDVNIGAATVTANYDGFHKHATVIGDGAHIGSDTMLVAPVKVGKRAWTGAGSVITRDVPDGALAVERSDQRNVAGYDRRRRAKERGAGSSKRKKDVKGRGRVGE